LLALSLPFATRAETLHAPQIAGSAFDLINAVNALRASNGLSPYSINSILMYTAQNQADFMAANGIVTHSGLGGIGLTDRLLAAGYPLAGDLALGGFRAENIISGSEDLTAQSAVDAWSGDAPHLDTMLSPNLTEIGAGVAIAGGRVYCVIDAAHPTTSGAPLVAVTSVGGGSAALANEAPIAVVVVSTPNADGDVIHDVLFGQTLWQIAISYDVKVDDIKRLNNRSDDYIYPGEKLLVKKAAVMTTENPIEISKLTATVPPTETEPSVPTTTMSTPTFTTADVNAVPPAHGPVTGVVIGIIAIALLVGGVFTSLGNTKKSEQ
jgi:LysM repeat protein